MFSHEVRNSIPSLALPFKGRVLARWHRTAYRCAGRTLRYFWIASQICALLIIASYFDLRQTIFIDRDENVYRFATNLAILDVFLGAGRAVNQQGDPLTAIRTFNFDSVL